MPGNKQLPPNVKVEDDSLTALITDAGSGRHPGGRPQSPIRSWFIEIYHNDTLTGEALHSINNIKAYQCPSCKRIIGDNHLKYLKRHVRNCALFPQNHKGICISATFSLPPSQMPPIPPSQMAPIPSSQISLSPCR